MDKDIFSTTATEECLSCVDDLIDSDDGNPLIMSFFNDFFHALAYFILIRRFQYDSIVRIGTIELGITRSIEGYDRYVLADSYVHRTTVIRNEERASFYRRCQFA